MSLSLTYVMMHRLEGGQASPEWPPEEGVSGYCWDQGMGPGEPRK